MRTLIIPHNYDVKLFIYVQGLNSRYFEHYWEDL